MGCSFVPLTMTAVNGVAPHETGLASALLNTGQQVGGAIGLAAFGTVFAHAAADRASEIGQRAGTAAGQADIFVAGQQHAFQAGDRGDSAGVGLVAGAHPRQQGRPAGRGCRSGAR